LSRNCDKDWLASWSKTENYFLASVAHLAQFKKAVLKPHKDLGPQSIERIKGFASHLMVNYFFCVIYIHNIDVIVRKLIQIYFIFYISECII
jgi:hypothetical protein